MKKIGIKGIGSYVPERVVPNSYFEKVVDTTDEWIVTLTGIQTRRMIEPGQDLSDLFQRVWMKQFEAARLDVETSFW